MLSLIRLPSVDSLTRTIKLVTGNWHQVFPKKPKQIHNFHRRLLWISFNLYQQRERCPIILFLISAIGISIFFLNFLVRLFKFMVGNISSKTVALPCFLLGYRFLLFAKGYRRIADNERNVTRAIKSADTVRTRTTCFQHVFDGLKCYSPLQTKIKHA